MIFAFSSLHSHFLHWFFITVFWFHFHWLRFFILLFCFHFLYFSFFTLLFLDIDYISFHAIFSQFSSSFHCLHRFRLPIFSSDNFATFSLLFILSSVTFRPMFSLSRFLAAIIIADFAIRLDFLFFARIIAISSFSLRFLRFASLLFSLSLVGYYHFSVFQFSYFQFASLRCFQGFVLPFHYFSAVMISSFFYFLRFISFTFLRFSMVFQ